MRRSRSCVVSLPFLSSFELRSDFGLELAALLELAFAEALFCLCGALADVLRLLELLELEEDDAWVAEAVLDLGVVLPFVCAELLLELAGFPRRDVSPRRSQ